MLRIKFWPWIEARKGSARGQLSALQRRVKRGERADHDGETDESDISTVKDQASDRMSVRRVMQESNVATAREQGGRGGGLPSLPQVRSDGGGKRRRGRATGKKWAAISKETSGY